MLSLATEKIDRGSQNPRKCKSVRSTLQVTIVCLTTLGNLPNLSFTLCTSLIKCNPQPPHSSSSSFYFLCVPTKIDIITLSSPSHHPSSKPSTSSSSFPLLILSPSPSLSHLPPIRIHRQTRRYVRRYVGYVPYLGIYLSRYVRIYLNT